MSRIEKLQRASCSTESKLYPCTSPCPEHKAGSKTIAIIGSTGFLGPFLVAALLQRHHHATIVCYNRRADGEKRTIQGLQNIAGHAHAALDRLHFCVLDVTASNFSSKAVGAITASHRVDEWVFNAWDPRWDKPLDYFEPLLGALRVMIDFCITESTSPRITFVSSVCAVGDWSLVQSEHSDVPEEVVWDHDAAMPHGYGQSKCLAEQMLATAHKVSGLRASIMRVSQIGGPLDSSIAARWPRQGWIFSLIDTSRALGYFPAHVQALDWIPVDSLAEGIANSINDQPAVQPFRVFNMVHPAPAPWSVLHNTLVARLGFTFRLCTLPEWLHSLESGKLKLHGFLRAAGIGREHNMSFSTNAARTILPSVATIDENLLARWLTAWRLTSQESKARI